MLFGWGKALRPKPALQPDFTSIAWEFARNFVNEVELIGSWGVVVRLRGLRR